METLFRKYSSSAAISRVKTSPPTWKWMPTEVCLHFLFVSAYGMNLRPRQLHHARRSHRLLPPRQPLQPLPVRPRTQRPMVIRPPPSSANPFHLYPTPLEQDCPCRVRLESVSNKIHGARNCRLSRGLDGKGGAKFSGRQT